ncbi:hypothetical protein LOK49_LG09G02578 [Camellia lanceoleosa]|uniref:Uncharacterized protein n=1 Tax=Camellia lanceoleosa TaxID=1840588 RepID=A0ACC0GMC2_9ERIC|nr:hypothetical protein LOK49_LG09G02578 [Camellia lanceoleosa]
MASAWNKLKKSLSLKLFRSESSQTSLQRSTNLLTDSSEPESRSSTVSSRSASLSISRLSRSISTRSSKKTCAICLAHLKTGEGQAIFTAECTHCSTLAALPTALSTEITFAPFAVPSGKTSLSSSPPTLAILGLMSQAELESLLTVPCLKTSSPTSLMITLFHLLLHLSPITSQMMILSLLSPLIPPFLVPPIQ